MIFILQNIFHSATGYRRFFKKMHQNHEKLNTIITIEKIYFERVFKKKNEYTQKYFKEFLRKN